MKDIIDTLQDSPEGIAPGFLETRRRLLLLPLLALPAASAFSARGIASQMSQDGPTTGSLDWVSFLKQCVPLPRSFTRIRHRRVKRHIYTGSHR